MKFRLLGHFEVVSGARSLTVPNGARGALLAALALQAGDTIGHDDLVLLVWGEQLPARPRQALHTVVARLRAWLRTVSADLPAALVTTESGYRLEILREVVDLHEFRTLLERARRMRATDRQPEEVDLLGAALALWHGRPLGNVPSVVLQRELVPTVMEERNSAMERYTALRLQHGHHEEMIGRLLTETNHEPLNEKFCYHLMIAFYRSGRRASALQAYSALSESLQKELGVIPHPRLQQLRAEIVQGRPPTA